MFVRVLEDERKRRGWTQAQFARRIGFSERAYRGQVSGQNQMHPRTQDDVARALRSPRLALAALAEFEDNPFAPAMLDVDDHPAQELCAALAELREALEAVGGVDVCRPDRAAVERAADQMMDLVHLVPAVLTSWARAYGIDLWTVRAKNLGKLQARGYLSTENMAA